jgi:PAS domain S-box-containing protein
MDETGRMPGWNRHARDLFFCMPEEAMAGTNVYDCIHPDSLGHVREQFRIAFADRIDIPVETRVLHSGISHHEWWKIETNGVVIGGQPCLMITGTDITGLKLREDKLNEQKTRFSQALEAAYAGVWEWNLKTDENIWSDEIWPLYDLEKGCSKPSFELWTSTICHEDREMVILTVSDAVKRDARINVEYRICCLDGSVRWLMVRGRPVHDNHGLAVSYIGTVIDITERKQLREQLLSSGDRYHSLFEAIPKAIAHCRLIYENDVPVDFIYLNVNLAFESLTGYRNVAGKRLTEVMPVSHQASFEKLFKLFCRVANTGNPEQMDYYIETFDEWTSVSAASSEKDHFIATFDVITDLKKAERIALEGKAKLEAVLSSMTDAVFFSDKLGRIIDFNEAFAVVHRFRSKKEYLTRLAEYPKLFELFKDNGELVPLEQWPVPRALRGETVRNFEYTLRRRDTGETWVASYGFAPILDNHGQIVGSVVTGRDVTEQKLMENALRENEFKFRSLFDHAPVAIGIGDINERRLFEVNTSWVRFFGYSREELIGRCLDDLEMFAELEGHGMIGNILEEQGEIVNRHIPIRKKSGEVMIFPFTVEIISVDDRPSLKVIMMDITQAERVENEPVSHRVTALNIEKIVDDSTAGAYHRDERLQNFMSIMYHECISSLAMIRANVGLIELKMKFGDCMNDIELNKINRAIDQIEDLLKFANQVGSSSESGKIESLTVFRMAPVIAAPIESFRAMWPERSLIYLEDVDDGEVMGIPFRIKVAIFNLLDNARKYSPPDSLIRMQSCIEGSEVVIRLRYQGTGITQDAAEITFEKSIRGHNFYYKTGSRLGLWLVKDIVESHNGSVTLECIESGVEITVRLPLNDRSD